MTQPLTVKMQLTIPEGHHAVIAHIAELRQSSLSKVATDYLIRSLSDNAKRELELLKEWAP